MEDVPIFDQLISTTQENSTKTNIHNLLFAAAEHMDKTLIGWGYTSQIDTLKAMSNIF